MSGEILNRLIINFNYWCLRSVVGKYIRTFFTIFHDLLTGLMWFTPNYISFKSNILYKAGNATQLITKKRLQYVSRIKASPHLKTIQNNLINKLNNTKKNKSTSCMILSCAYK